MHKLIKWVTVHPVMSVLVVIIICLGSCYFCIHRPLDPPEIIRQVGATASQRIAFVEQINYASGLQTCVADQVRIADRVSDSQPQDIVFTEDVEPLSQKPIVEWKGDVLTIYVARDANVLLRKDTLGNISIKFVRRE